MVTALAQLGVELGLPAELPPAELAARARDALGERSGWLLIFDNAPDPAAVAEFLPGAGGGHVLVTSRDSAWQGIADPVPVDLLPPKRTRSGCCCAAPAIPTEQAATRLAEALGRLPLALEQAAAYAAQQRLPLARYLELFAQRRDELLALGKPLAYQGTVDATFTLALDQLRSGQPGGGPAAGAVRAAGARRASPLPAAQRAGAATRAAGGALWPTRCSRVRWSGCCTRAGLLTRDVADTARMHRLVQVVTLAHLPEADRHQRTIARRRAAAPGCFPTRAGSRTSGRGVRSCSPTPKRYSTTPARLQLTSPAVSPVADRHRPVTCGAADWIFSLRRSCTSRPWPIYQRLYEGDHPDVAASSPSPARAGGAWAGAGAARAGPGDVPAAVRGRPPRHGCQPEQPRHRPA